jgi:hypothetical protein
LKSRQKHLEKQVEQLTSELKQIKDKFRKEKEKRKILEGF